MDSSPAVPTVLDDVTEVVSTSIWPHLFTVGGFVLAVFAIARLMSEKRQPGNTIAWLLGIVLIPYVGVPLYLLFGGRKIKQLVARKDLMRLHLPGAPQPPDSVMHLPVTRNTISNGAAPPVGGNRLRLLKTGEASFDAFVTQIRAAKHTIHITTFILGRDDTGRLLVQELARKAKEGVTVRLLLDGLGSFLAAGRFCDPIRDAGGDVRRFMPVAPLSTRHSANLRNHRKIAVFDHQTAIVGGRNMAKEYMGDAPWDQRWTDFGALVEGPAAGLVDEVFFADWNYASDQPIETLRQEGSTACPAPQGDCSLQVIASGPDVSGDPLYEGLISFVQEAERSIWIITPYFIPDEVLQRSLLVKARSGVDVTVIVPAKSNHAVTDYARRQYLRELHTAGARVLLYQRGMLHAKAVIMDDKLAIFGSANLDLRSLFVNFEIGIAVYSASEVAAIRAWAGELVRDCETYIAGATPRRWTGVLAEDLSRLLAPLL